MKRTSLFMDLEFTGLHQSTTAISLGIISECGKTFYAEFADYDKTQLNDWLEENVISGLWVTKYDPITPLGIVSSDELRWADVHVFGTSDFIKEKLEEWLSQFEKIAIWSDCLAYDWVLFNQIWGCAFWIPENILYIPFDISTYFEIKGIDPDISREDYCEIENFKAEKTKVLHEDFKSLKHNALWDAFIIRECYNKLRIS